MLNEKILLSARYGSMKSVWDFFQPCVERKRRELGRPLLYMELEAFLRDNAARYRQYQKKYGDRQSGQEPVPALAQRTGT